jgi:hypothetical protein
VAFFIVIHASRRRWCVGSKVYRRGATHRMHMESQSIKEEIMQKWNRAKKLKKEEETLSSNRLDQRQIK